MHTLKCRLGNYNAGILLDVAVGRGDFLKFALGSFRSWKTAAGIDIDTESLVEAGVALEKMPVILLAGSALSMPFISDYFDTVTMSNALHHIESLQALFIESGRVCKPNGLIVINEMIKESNIKAQETYMLYHRFVAEVDNQLGRYHREPFSEKELQALIKQSGLKLQDAFIHEETTGNMLDKEEIQVFSDKIRSKVKLLRGTDYYYFYENKAREIMNRLNNAGLHRPRHITFFLQPARVALNKTR
jgi:ubiquinone/menaquinone biosynthesis C-methylase UbiE